MTGAEMKKIGAMVAIAAVWIDRHDDSGNQEMQRDLAAVSAWFLHGCEGAAPLPSDPLLDTAADVLAERSAGFIQKFNARSKE